MASDQLYSQNGGYGDGRGSKISFDHRGKGEEAKNQHWSRQRNSRETDQWKHSHHHDWNYHRDTNSGRNSNRDGNKGGRGRGKAAGTDGGRFGNYHRTTNKEKESESAREGDPVLHAFGDSFLGTLTLFPKNLVRTQKWKGASARGLANPNSTLKVAPHLQQCLSQLQNQYSSPSSSLRELNTDLYKPINILLVFGQVDLAVNYLHQLQSKSVSGEALGWKEWADEVYGKFEGWVKEEMIPLLKSKSQMGTRNGNGETKEFIDNLFISTVILPVVEDEYLEAFLEKYRGKEGIQNALKDDDLRGDSQEQDVNGENGYDEKHDNHKNGVNDARSKPTTIPPSSLPPLSHVGPHDLKTRLKMVNYYNSRLIEELPKLDPGGAIRIVDLNSYLTGEAKLEGRTGEDREEKGKGKERAAEKILTGTAELGLRDNKGAGPPQCENNGADDGLLRILPQYLDPLDPLNMHVLWEATLPFWIVELTKTSSANLDSDLGVMKDALELELQRMKERGDMEEGVGRWEKMKRERMRREGFLFRNGELDTGGGESGSDLEKESARDSVSDSHSYLHPPFHHNSQSHSHPSTPTGAWRRETDSRGFRSTNETSWRTQRRDISSDGTSISSGGESGTNSPHSNRQFGTTWRSGAPSKTTAHRPKLGAIETGTQRSRSSQPSHQRTQSGRQDAPFSAFAGFSPSATSPTSPTGRWKRGQPVGVSEPTSPVTKEQKNRWR